jgi:hypothetical protein
MAAFEITTQSSDLMPLDRRGRGEVKFLVTNGLGRNVRAQLRAEPDGDQGARSDWLIVDRTEHAFAPGAAIMVTVKVGVPAGTPAGRYPFRLVVAATDEQGGEQGGEPARSAPVTLRHDTSNRALWVALVIGGILVVAIGAGLYRWLLGPPACAVERAVYDDAAAACVCPDGMVEGQIGARRICLCASGTAYDERSDTCVARSCDVDGALYAEAAARCECPLGTQQAMVGDRSRCVCPLGQKYDPGNHACAPHACSAPEGAYYDERTGQCECPPGAQKTTSATGQEACECPAGYTFDQAAQRCLTMPNLRVSEINVFPPLRIHRQFRLETAVGNTGETASGPSRLYIEVSRAGVSFRDQYDVPALAPGKESKYRSPTLRIEINEPVHIRVRAEPLGFTESSAEDNVVEQSFRIRTRDEK